VPFALTNNTSRSVTEGSEILMCELEVSLTYTNLPIQITQIHLNVYSIKIEPTEFILKFYFLFSGNHVQPSNQYTLQCHFYDHYMVISDLYSIQQNCS
jgi:hypothetical protein